MKKQRYAVLVVMDGLRQDMISREHTPAVSALQENGLWYDAVRTVFPSVTRVVSSSLATGVSPERHGLFGNCVALFENDGYTVHNVGSPAFLPHWRSLRGRTLAMPTLAERLAPRGQVRIFSNVSPGAAYLQDPDGHGFVYHRAGCFGPGGAILPPLSGIDKGAPGDAALTDMCLGALDADTPPLSVLWLSDPDHTGHNNPLGSPVYYEALRSADACVAKVYQYLCGRPQDEWLLVVCSDHGQETETECVDVTRLLVEAGLKEAMDSRELVVAPNGSAGLVYMAPSCGHSFRKVQNFFVSQSWCGEIRSFAQDDAAAMQRDIPAFYFSMAKTSQCNAYGIAGTTLSVYDPYEPKDRMGCGTHGGLGVYEQSPFLFLRGPDHPKGARISRPASLLDIAPAVLAHHGIVA